MANVTGMSHALRAADKTTALTARRARPVLGIGMGPASTAVVSAPSAPT
ncbi:amino acid transporter [Xanthomonas oryzae pv. oryzicola]|nr:amino acid transporter [Xanthomonas oryzae pv. oryzicola]